MNGRGKEVMKSILSMITVLFLWTTGVQATTIGFDPVSPTVPMGNTFSVNIVGNGFPLTQGGGINLFFNPSIVNVTSVSIDANVWNFVNGTGTINNTGGSLTSVFMSAFPGVGPGSFTVATINLLAVGSGSTPLTLTEYALNPWASDGNEINPLFNAGSVNVAAAIPEPASIVLMGTGLAGILRLARRK